MKIQNLIVSINVDPEPEIFEGPYDEVKVSIDYDKNATDKYYQIGGSGELKKYDGEFKIDKNCTVYAYALKKDGEETVGKGTAQKTIDNLSNGIAEPEIILSPRNGVQAQEVTVDIKYDKIL